MATSINQIENTSWAATKLWMVAVGMAALYFITALARSGVAFDFIIDLPKALIVGWKGFFTALLGLAVFVSARRHTSLLIAISLVIIAVADMMLVTVGIIFAGLGFALAHFFAMCAYLKERADRNTPKLYFLALLFPVVVTVFCCSMLAYANQPWSMGLFVLLSSSMAATALLSRFPLLFSGVGAVIFVLSDAIFFADRAFYDGTGRLGWLVWLCFATGLALVAFGAIQFNRTEQKAEAD